MHSVSKVLTTFLPELTFDIDLNITTVQDIPAFGSRGFLLQDTPSYTPVTFETDRNNNIVIDNEFIKATFDKSGHLIGLRDKAGYGRELIREGERGNVFTMYEDIPLFWDAWYVIYF
jgi:alpha-mannosidase